MLENEPRDRSIPGGTLRWGLTMTYRSWKFTSLGFLAAVATTSPIAFLIGVLYFSYPGSQMAHNILLLYWFLILAIGVVAGSLLRKFYFSFDLSDMSQTEIPGARMRDSHVDQDPKLLVLFIIGGYTIFGLFILGIATIVGYFLGVLAAGLMLLLLLNVEVRLNRDHEKSLIAGFIRLTKSGYVAVRRPSFRQRRVLDNIEAGAIEFGKLPFTAFAS